MYIAYICCLANFTSWLIFLVHADYITESRKICIFTLSTMYTILVLYCIGE